MIQMTGEELQALKAELQRLRAIVDKLPKTADEVPVTPGMRVWHCPDDTMEQIARFNRPYCFGWKCYDSGCQGDSSSGTHRNWEECYSTREAAEAAAKGVSPSCPTCRSFVDCDRMRAGPPLNMSCWKAEGGGQ